jgi:hypothetical protein
MKTTGMDIEQRIASAMEPEPMTTFFPVRISVATAR